MTRLLVLVEGQTEERFVNSLLRNHLSAFEVFVSDAKLIGARRAKERRGGIVSWPSAKKDILRCLQDPGVTLTTMVDFYAMPISKDRCWPDRDRAAGTAVEKSTCVEQAIFSEIAREFDDQLSRRRFIPFVMIHEFEALLFSQPTAIVEWLGGNAVDDLESIRDEFPDPEEINDSKETAPSKRIENLIPHYQKVVHGNDIVELIGLPTIRSQCRHFHDWLTTLEGLGKPPVEPKV